ncbi:MAG: glycosyltransferase, partial [Pseudomonadales bacterium]
MKIALVVTDLAPARIGGISRVATELGANLASLGHRVLAYVLQRDRNPGAREYRGIELRYIEPFPTPNRDYPVVGFSRRAFARLAVDARRESFDVVHSFNLNSIALPRFAGELSARGIKLAVSSFETIMMDVRAKFRESLSLLSPLTVPQIAFESYLAIAHERRYLGTADAVFTEDENTRGALLQMGIDDARVHVIPSGVDLEASRAASLPRVDLGAPGPRVGYIGRADPRMGVQYL